MDSHMLLQFASGFENPQFSRTFGPIAFNGVVFVIHVHNRDVFRQLVLRTELRRTESRSRVEIGIGNVGHGPPTDDFGGGWNICG